MLKNMQLNQPSVMKNSTGAGVLSQVAKNPASTAQEDDKVGALSSTLLRDAGNKVIIDRSVNGSINRIGGITGGIISEANDAQSSAKDTSSVAVKQQ